MKDLWFQSYKRKKNILMQDPNLKCRHFGILWHILAFYGILVKKVMREELR